MNNKEIMEVIQAFEDGKPIELCGKRWLPDGVWTDARECRWNFLEFDYRIKESVNDLLLDCLQDLSIWQDISVEQFGERDSDTDELIERLEKAIKDD